MLSPGRKLAATAGLFAVALITVALAAATTSYVPLFFTILPLIGVAWVLSRDEPGEEPKEGSSVEPVVDETRG
jgi:hypothetical protein